jgi:hypothetical protein
VAQDSGSSIVLMAFMFMLTGTLFYRVAFKISSVWVDLRHHPHGLEMTLLRQLVLLWQQLEVDGKRKLASYSVALTLKRLNALSTHS